MSPEGRPFPTARIAAAAAFALVAFATNSVLCRIALGEGRIDAASFTAIRLASGAAVLWAAVAMTRAPGAAPSRRAWAPPFMLFVYAAAFSFAYLRLSIGAGALLLFGSVQVTMMLAGLRLGERPGRVQWLGIAAALAGLVILVRPGLSAPPPGAAALMAAAGVAWGGYSLFGRRAAAALPATSANFARSVPPALAVVAVAHSHVHVTPSGAALAVASGAVASGLGYVAWYAALPGLTATRAAVVQLAVPVLAAAAGVVLLGEAVSARLAVSAAAILGGIALTLGHKWGGGS